MIESRDFPSLKVKLYYYLPRKRLQDATRRGLQPQKPSFVLGSEVRKTPCVFCYLQPEDELWGLAEKDDYKLLQVRVDPQLCVVADQALFLKGWEFENGKHFEGGSYEMAREWISRYDRRVLPLKFYRQGMLECPEVLVRSSIPPKDIEVAE